MLGDGPGVGGSNVIEILVKDHTRGSDVKILVCSDLTVSNLDFVACTSQQ